VIQNKLLGYTITTQYLLQMSSSTSHLYLTRTADGTHSPGSKARDSSAVFASQELFEIRDFLRSPSSHREESTRPITSLINKFLNIRMNVVYDSSSTRVSVERTPIGTIMQDSVKPSNQHTSPRLAVASTLYALPHTPCNRLGAENLVHRIHTSVHYSCNHSRHTVLLHNRIVSSVDMFHAKKKRNLP
jgi:hypothetical protein